jgi:hypothetical protein
MQGYINTQNNCYWNSQNPHLTHNVWHTVRERRILGPVFFKETINCKNMYRSFSGNSFRVNRRRKTEWLVSARLSYCPLCTYVYTKLCAMSSGREISAMVVGQHVHLTLILAIFSSVVL